MWKTISGILSPGDAPRADKQRGGAGAARCPAAGALAHVHAARRPGGGERPPAPRALASAGRRAPPPHPCAAADSFEGSTDIQVIKFHMWRACGRARTLPLGLFNLLASFHYGACRYVYLARDDYYFVFIKSMFKYL